MANEGKQVMGIISFLMDLIPVTHYRISITQPHYPKREKSFQNEYSIIVNHMFNLIPLSFSGQNS